MTHNKTTRKFNVGDIVTISNDYKEFATLDIDQPQIQVYSIWKINQDGTIHISGVWSDIPLQYIEGVPVESELAKQIYYDTNHARPYLPFYDFPKEDIYSRPPFMVTMEERLRNTPIWEKMQTEEFHYVHEIQHWLIEHYGYSRICINQFWGMRKPIYV